MREKGAKRLSSSSECLYVIEKFGREIAKMIVGGSELPLNHSCGDLEHKDGSYSEVKASQVSAGPIIPQEQLIRHYEDWRRCERYVFVLYEGRRWDSEKGKYISMPVRIGMGQGERALRAYLAQKLKAVYVVHVSVVWAIFQFHKEKGDLQNYPMQSGRRIYVKIPYTDLKNIAKDQRVLSQFQLDLGGYEVQNQDERQLQVSYFRPRVNVVKILSNTITDDDSFNVVEFEQVTA